MTFCRVGLASTTILQTVERKRFPFVPESCFKSKSGHPNSQRMAYERVGY